LLLLPDQVELVHHNIETQPLPFKSESVDHVFFLEVLEHLEMDPFFAILEMHRVLKFNGGLPGCCCQLFVCFPVPAMY
jgi:ubiquinone/menaquinone biosynthesis C-methylase UbiE